MNTSMSQDARLESSPSALRSILVRLFLTCFILGGFAAGIWGSLHFVSLSQMLLTVALDPPLFSPFGKPKTESAPDWRNKERVNVLIMGVDRRPDEATDDPVRTDTMMLVTLDPASQTAGMLSIPRDLLVPIPLPSKDCTYLPWGNPYGQERINTAYLFGQLCAHPTGGPGLAKETVQYNFGIKVHYYVLIDFDTFEEFIDAIGGVDLEVPERLIDYQYPTRDYGIMKIDIPAGPQHLNGERSLWYVRSRHMDSDFGRMQRQQQFLLALRERLLQFSVLPRLPQLALQYHEAVRTDLSSTEIAALLLIAKDVQRENIVNRSLEFPYVTSITGADGAAYLVPMRERVREVVAEVFTDNRLQQENASVEVLNGAGVAGLAARTAESLKDQGISNVTTGNASDDQPHRTTKIYNNTGKPYTAAVIAGALGVPQDRIVPGEAAPDGPDIRVVLGEDLQDR